MPEDAPGGAWSVLPLAPAEDSSKSGHDDFQQLPKGFILVKVSSVSRFIDLLQHLVFQ
jgi:hypothetical protein